MRRVQLRLLPEVDLTQRYIDAFIQAKLASNRAAGTIQFYGYVLREFARFVPEWPPMAEDVSAYLLERRMRVSESSVRSGYRGVASFLNWCERRGYLIDNPLQRVDAPPEPRTLPRAATPAQIGRVLATMAAAAQTGEKLAVRDHAIFRLCYDTGVRASELARARLDDLEMDYNALMVRRGKGGKDRTVYFGARCAAALRMWLQTHPGSEWLFVNRLRTELRPLTRGGVYKALRRWCERAGIRLTVHQLRHSYATHALRRGIDLEHVSRQLGHSSIATTAIYLAADDPARRQAHLDKAPGDVV